jgi:hypothetical protein
VAVIDQLLRRSTDHPIAHLEITLFIVRDEILQQFVAKTEEILQATYNGQVST